MPSPPLRLLVISLLVAVCPTAAAQQIFYVDDTATGTNDGTNWQDAFTDLQSALAVATQADSVWVARGTYKPTATLDRTATFSVDTSIYGGFDGTETTLADRAGLFDETTLTGDLLGNDGPEFAGNEENSANVLSVLNLLIGFIVLDGFTVQGGNSDIGLRSGGGLYVRPKSSTRVVRNCTFTGNEAGRGGAISGASTAVVDIERCTFLGNRARFDGGGVFGEDMDVRSCFFSGNRAGRDGGGLWAPGRVVDCVFSGNVAGEEGGGVYYPYWVMNCTFSGNSASIGGGTAGGYPGARYKLENCVLWENHDRTGETQSGQFAGYLSIVEDNVVQGWNGTFPGTGNFDADPLFRSPLGADGQVGTVDDDLSVEVGSTCIDSARASGYFGLGIDALGQPRFVDSLGCDGGGILDRGAIERQEVDGTSVYCDSTASSIGVRAEIGGPCTATPTGGTFTVLARPIPDGRAFLWMGDPGTPLPFGNGNLCLTGQLRRIGPVVPSGGTVTFLVDPTLPPASDVLVPGATVGLQVVFRDAAAGGAGFNLSSAMRLLALP